MTSSEVHVLSIGSSVKDEIQQLRQNLTSIDGNNDILVKILDKFRQLTEAEEAVVESQRDEIQSLREQLQNLSSASCPDSNNGAVLSKFDIRNQLEEELDSLRDSHNALHDSCGGSERKKSGSVDDFEAAVIDDQLEEELHELQNGSNDIINEEPLTTSERRSSMADGLVAVKMHLEAEISGLQGSKQRINEEITTLRKQVKLLAAERTSLVQEVEVYDDMSALASDLSREKKDREKADENLSKLREQLSEVITEKNAALQKSKTEVFIRDEMQSEMQSLFEEKIKHEKELEDLKVSVSNSFSESRMGMDEADVRKMKEEIEIIRAENESLRVTAKREAANREVLRSEMKALSAENFMMKRGGMYNDEARNTPASRKRALASSQGWPGDDIRENKRSINYEPARDRLGSASSDNDTSSVHESDNVSILFGQDSIAGRMSENPAGSSTISGGSKSEYSEIRAHAAKLLYWANKATERQKSVGSGSVTSGSPSLTRQHQHSVPTSIGLPPRSHSRETKRPGSLPPRPPQVPQEEGTINAYRNDAAGAFPGDEENRTTWNIIPSKGHKHQQSSPHKQVSVSDTAIIYNIETIQYEEPCCQCAVSPFSGEDPHADFFLPKLGLACTCRKSSVVMDRECFSMSPTAIRNILRSWQCAFLESINIHTADQLLRAHKAGANKMARQMKKWREENDMKTAKSKQCYVALQIWSRTAKVVLRSIQRQRESGETVIEKPSFLDVTFPCDAHSVSTLGYGSSVGGPSPYEMMEI